MISAYTGLTPNVKDVHHGQRMANHLEQVCVGDVGVVKAWRVNEGNLRADHGGPCERNLRCARPESVPHCELIGPADEVQKLGYAISNVSRASCNRCIPWIFQSLLCP